MAAVAIDATKQAELVRVLDGLGLLDVAGNRSRLPGNKVARVLLEVDGLAVRAEVEAL